MAARQRPEIGDQRVDGVRTRHQDQPALVAERPGGAGNPLRELPVGQCGVGGDQCRSGAVRRQVADERDGCPVGALVGLDEHGLMLSEASLSNTRVRAR